MVLHLLPRRLMAIGIAAGLIEVIAAALVGAWFYKECQQLRRALLREDTHSARGRVHGRKISGRILGDRGECARCRNGDYL